MKARHPDVPVNPALDELARLLARVAVDDFLAEQAVSKVESGVTLDEAQDNLEARR